MKSFGRQKFNFMEEFIKKKKNPESLKHTHNEKEKEEGDRKPERKKKKTNYKRPKLTPM